jgi:hypothetical protein
MHDESEAPMSDQEAAPSWEEALQGLTTVDEAEEHPAQPETEEQDARLDADEIYELDHGGE